MAVLAWHNVIFYIPLFVGIVLILGILFGIAELPHGWDTDADGGPEVDGGGEVDGGADGHHEGGVSAGGPQVHGVGQGLLVLLGFGRAPVLVLLMSMTLIFGGTGIVANLALGRLLEAQGAFVLVSLLVALCATVVFTGLIGRVVNRFMPTLETTSVTKHDLIGCIGSLVLSSNEREGLVQITKQGDVFQVTCRSAEPLERGTSVLVTSYDRERGLYFVSRNPLG